ncbi:MAG TPA: carboxypeptidase-like regulatory domain-containing protein [Terracidiphilus sp.]
MENHTKGLTREIGSLLPGMRLAALLSLLLLALSCSAGAQVSTASVNGVIRDPNGGVIPGATIVLHSIETSVEHSSISNNAGAYVLLNITPGRYTIQASAKGFNPQKTDEFVLAVDQIATFDFSLKVGAETQVVSVNAAAAQLDVTGATLGTVIETKQVNELPLDGRNFTALLSLTPGVVPIMVGQNAGMQGSGGFGAAVAIGSDYTFPAINGQTGRSNFFLMDGLFNYGTIESTYAIAPIIDAIQEMKVVSHTDDAEFGGVLGGVVNVVTKSGTNDIHGAAWEYVRNTVFDARGFFLPTSSPKPFYHQNQFGASGGGPVVIPKLYNGRNKTFFFGAYQGYRYSTPANSQLLVPTDAEYAGNEADNHQPQIYDPFTTTCVAVGTDPCGTFSRTPFEGNQIPASRLSQANTQAMIAWAKFVFPAAGPCLQSTNGFCSANALDTTPTTQVQNEFNVRGDQTFGAKDSAWFRYSFINSTVNKSNGLPGLPDHHILNARDWGGSYVHIFGPTRIIQVQFAHATVVDNSTNFFKASTADIISTVGFSPNFVGGFAAAGGKSLLPGPGISGFANSSESVNLTPKATDTWEYRGTYTQIIGSHEIKFGAGFDTNNFASPLAQVNEGFGAAQTGLPSTSAATGDAFTSFLLDVPSPNGPSRRNVNEQEQPGGLLSAFLQDSWKMTRRLTLNYGLRYDYPFLPRYGTRATVGQEGGPETGEMDWNTGNWLIQQLPPLCTVRGFAPCIPGTGLPAHVVVSPNGKITHNIHTNYGPRFGFAFKVNDKTVTHGAFGIVFDDWAAVAQMAQNFEGSWPDIGQQIAATTTNVPTSTQLTPNVTAQDPFSGGGGGGLFPAATPFGSQDWYFDPNIKNAYSEQWNFGVQRQLGGSMALKVDYVGSTTHRANVGGLYGTALTPGPGDQSLREPYPYAPPTFYDRSVGNGSYNALQVQLDRRYSGGYSYQIAYTKAKSLTVDDGWFGIEGTSPQDPYHPQASRGYSATNIPNLFVANGLYAIPVGPGKRFSTGNRVGDYILGNWQINSVFTWRNGQPFNVSDSFDAANTGAGQERPNVVGKIHNGPHTQREWFNTSGYAAPALYTYGNSYTNDQQMQRWINLDASVIRSFPIWREKQFQFRAESFNLLNHPIFGQPGSDINSPANFGQIGSSQANLNRQLQMSGKIIF